MGTELTRHHIAIIDYKQITPCKQGAAPLARYALVVTGVVTGVGALGAFPLPLAFFLPFPSPLPLPFPLPFPCVLVLGVIATNTAAAAAPIVLGCVVLGCVVLGTTAVDRAARVMPNTALVHEDGWRAHSNGRHLMREAIRGQSVPMKGLSNT